MTVDEKKTGSAGIKGFIATVFVLCLFIAAVFSAYMFSQDRARGLMPASNLRFASGLTHRMNGMTEKDWKSVGEDAHIFKDSWDTYLHVRGSLPAEAIEGLRIKGANATYIVKVDGRTVYDSLKDGINLSPASFADIKLGPSDAGKAFELTAYAPLTDSISIFYVQESNHSLPVDLFWGLALVVIATAIFLCLHRNRDRFWKLSAQDFIPLSLLLSAFVVGLNQMPAHTILLMIQIACAVAICTIVVFYFIVRSSGWNGNVEVLFVINILYFIVVLFMPYKMFVLAVLRTGIILQLMNVLFLLTMRLRKRPFSLELLDAPAFLLMLCNFYFWYGLANESFEYAVPIFVSCVCVCAVYCTAVVRSAKRVKVTKEKPVKPTVSVVSQNEDEPSPRVPTPFGTAMGPQVRDAILALINSKGMGNDGHAVRVAEYVRIISIALGMHRSKADEMGDAALLHDIGKIVISNSLLHKDEVAEFEFQEIKRHTEYGYRMFCGYEDRFLTLTANIAREHHEHVDGSGYMGLKGTEISLPARITAVADVFDALTSYRSYKRTWSFEEAYQYIIENSGTYFDREVVQGFVRAEEKLRAAYEAQQSQPGIQTEHTKGGVS